MAAAGWRDNQEDYQCTGDWDIRGGRAACRRQHCRGEPGRLPHWPGHLDSIGALSAAASIIIHHVFPLWSSGNCTEWNLADVGQNVDYFMVKLWCSSSLDSTGPVLGYLCQAGDLTTSVS